MPRSLPEALRHLAVQHGIQLSYQDMRGEFQHASDESLTRALAALGVPAASYDEIVEASADAEASAWRRGVEPVTVAWQDRPATISLRATTRHAFQASCTLQLADGGLMEWKLDLTTAPVLGRGLGLGDTDSNTIYAVRLPGGLPIGYHRLHIRWAGHDASTLVLAAPTQIHPGHLPPRAWGAFLPLYALTSTRSLGAGDLGDLDRLGRWIGELGGAMVATLPLLASFLDRPFEPSPYAPASRLFWNEVYLDLERLPELASSSRARALLASPQVQDRAAALRAGREVDYRSLIALRHAVLDAIIEDLDRDCLERLSGWATQRPVRTGYARFRAVMERRGEPWTKWPERLKEGRLEPGDWDPAAAIRHLYAQWRMDQQVAALAELPTGLYLDLPLGVHPQGFDTWWERDAFARDARAGAPPDGFFNEGQDWGFPPLHPQRQREHGYRYLIACLRHHLKHASCLRVDHVMGLHRLYWIPSGLAKREGVYVRYPARELYAILAIESHLAEALLVGEDMGLVPPHVRRAMRRHGMPGIYCLQFESRPDPEQALNPIPESAVACLDTHDTPPFAAFLAESGPDLEKALAARLRWLGLMDSTEPSARDLLLASLAFLAAGPARAMVINLEDLWLETERQNQPGTGQELPNWRRRARLQLEEMISSPEIQEALRLVRDRRLNPT